MAKGKQEQQKKKADCAGRNGPKCKRYVGDHRREKNKEKALKRHLARCPNDEVAQKALANVWA